MLDADGSHGRLVKRWVSVQSTEPHRCSLTYVQTIIRINSRRNGGAWEDRYYISLQDAEAHTPVNWAGKVRRHWSVESKNHWRKDATLGEEWTRSRQPRILSNLMLLRQLTLYFYEKHGRENHEWLKSWVE